jgi:acetyl esterase
MMIACNRLALAGVSLGTLIGVATLTFAAAPALAQSAQQSPAAAMKAEMKEADKDMGRVLKKLQDLGAKPLGTQSVEETRKGPTPADAVKAVL